MDEIERLEIAVDKATAELDTERETIAELEAELADAKTDRDRYRDCLSDIYQTTKDMLR